MAWIFLNDAFLSIVAPIDANDPDTPSEHLLVRGRIKGDIERTFGTGYPVSVTPNRDYRFRTLIPRSVVGLVIAEAIEAIDYGNFKGSVPDDPRHDAYLDVWGTMTAYQRREASRPAPRARRPRKAA